MTQDATSELTLNGLSPQRSHEVQQRIRDDGDGDFARPLYRAEVAWTTGYRTVSRLAGGRTLEGDEPAAYGGSAQGASPQELLLTAVGNCVAATCIGGLSAQRIEVRSLRIDVSGRVNFKAAYGVAPGAPGFESVDVKLFIETDAPRERVDALLRKLLPTAPIPDTILRPVPLNVSIAHEAPGS